MTGNIPPTKPSSTPASSSKDLIFDSHQDRLLGILKAKNHKMYRCYLGALHVLRHEDNPMRFCMAAYSIRELITLLRKQTATPKQSNSQNLTIQFFNIFDKLLSTLQRLNSSWFDEKGVLSFPEDPIEAFSEEITESIKTSLVEMQKNKLLYKEHQISRREEVVAVLSAGDPAGVKMPKKLETVKVKEVTLYEDEFNKILHMNIEVSEQDFSDWLYHFEVLLTRLLKPETFKTQKRLKDLVAEAELNG